MIIIRLVIHYIVRIILIVDVVNVLLAKIVMLVVKLIVNNVMGVMLVKPVIRVNQNVKMANIVGLYIKKKLHNVQAV